MNMERITREDLYLQISEVLSQRGTCLRAKVGCVITQHDRIVSTGYNGPLPGEHSCTDQNCDLKKSCTRAVHAEANAIYFAAREGISLDGAALYCKYSPCTDCAEAIVQAGIKEVHFLEEFRDTQPLNRLLNCGLKIYKNGVAVLWGMYPDK